MSAPNEEWHSQAFRQNMTNKIDQVIHTYNLINFRNGIELENYLYQKARSRAEYLHFIAKLMIHIKNNKLVTQGTEQPAEGTDNPISIVPNLTRTVGTTYQDSTNCWNTPMEASCRGRTNNPMNVRTSCMVPLHCYRRGNQNSERENVNLDFSCLTDEGTTYQNLINSNISEMSGSEISAPLRSNNGTDLSSSGNSLGATPSQRPQTLEDRDGQTSEDNRGLNPPIEAPALQDAPQETINTCSDAAPTSNQITEVPTPDASFEVMENSLAEQSCVTLPSTIDGSNCQTANPRITPILNDSSNESLSTTLDDLAEIDSYLGSEGETAEGDIYRIARDLMREEHDTPAEIQNEQTRIGNNMSSAHTCPTRRENDPAPSSSTETISQRSQYQTTSTQPSQQTVSKVYIQKPIQQEVPMSEVDFSRRLLVTYRMFLHAHECDRDSCMDVEGILPAAVGTLCRRAKKIMEHFDNCNQELRCRWVDCLRLRNFQTHFKTCMEKHCPVCRVLKLQFDLSRQMRICVRNDCSFCWTLIQFNENSREWLAHPGLAQREEPRLLISNRMENNNSSNSSSSDDISIVPSLHILYGSHMRAEPLNMIDSSFRRSPCINIPKLSSRTARSQEPHGTNSSLVAGQSFHPLGSSSTNNNVPSQTSGQSQRVYLTAPRLRWPQGASSSSHDLTNAASSSCSRNNSQPSRPDFQNPQVRPFQGSSGAPSTSSQGLSGCSRSTNNDLPPLGCHHSLDLSSQCPGPLAPPPCRTIRGFVEPWTSRSIWVEEQLPQLVHDKNCKKRPENCTEPGCAARRGLRAHLAQCTEANCSFPNCNTPLCRYFKSRVASQTLLFNAPDQLDAGPSPRNDIQQTSTSSTSRNPLVDSAVTGELAEIPNQQDPSSSQQNQMTGTEVQYHPNRQVRNQLNAGPSTRNDSQQVFSSSTSRNQNPLFCSPATGRLGTGIINPQVPSCSVQREMAEEDLVLTRLREESNDLFMSGLRLAEESNVNSRGRHYNAGTSTRNDCQQASSSLTFRNPMADPGPTERRVINPQVASCSRQNRVVEDGVSLPKRIKLEEERDMDNQGVHADNDTELCKICMDAPLNTVFLKCGHIVACVGCANKSTNCPICREKSNWIRTFKA